jgi:hypothetical protein
MVQLPRRHAQRLAVRRNAQQGKPPDGQRLGRMQLKRRLRMKNISGDSSDEPNFAEGSDSFESDRDSGYSSANGVRDFFTQKIAEHKSHGPVMANHSDKTKDMIETGRAYFFECVPQVPNSGYADNITRFCDIMGVVDPEEKIKACEAEFAKGYLEWRVMFSRIKMQSAITTYWKVHSMLYMNVAKRYMEEEVLLDIRNVSSRDR